MARGKPSGDNKNQESFGMRCGEGGLARRYLQGQRIQMHMALGDKMLPSDNLQRAFALHHI